MVSNNAPDRRLLTKSKVGVRVCIGLLDNMVRLHEAEEGTDAAKAFDIGYVQHSYHFLIPVKWSMTIRYEIFTQMIEEGTVPDLYKKFSV